MEVVSIEGFLFIESVKIVIVLFFMENHKNFLSTLSARHHMIKLFRKLSPFVLPTIFLSLWKYLCISDAFFFCPSSEFFRSFFAAAW